MKRVYLNLYKFIWFCVSKHCSKLFNINNQTESLASWQSSSIWLYEYGEIVRDELEAKREKHCLVSLFKSYFASLQNFRKLRNELELSHAKKSYKDEASRIRFGKYILGLLLIVNTLLGLWVSFSYQSSLGVIAVAVLSYLAIGWGIWGARALPLFKTALVILITLTGLNTFFWSLWQKIISSTNECYSEICTLINPESIFQITTLKLPIITFWILFLALISFKTPITNYLTYRKSLNRKL